MRLERFDAFADGMDLQANKAGLGHVIFKVGHRFAVHPGFDAVALANDSELAPFLILEPRADFLGGLFRIQEFGAARFVIDAAGEAAYRDFNLVTVDSTVLIIGLALAADLHPGV